MQLKLSDGIEKKVKLSEAEDYDGEGAGGKSGQRNPGKRKKKETQGQKMAPRSTSSFDIMI